MSLSENGISGVEREIGSSLRWSDGFGSKKRIRDIPQGG
jgi:hypothetical protein